MSQDSMCSKREGRFGNPRVLPLSQRERALSNATVIGEPGSKHRRWGSESDLRITRRLAPVQPLHSISPGGAEGKNWQYRAGGRAMNAGQSTETLPQREQERLTSDRGEFHKQEFEECLSRG
jgi:hypothetical protein